MASGFSNNEWADRSQRMAADNRNTLESTTASIARSNQISIETEEIGTEILSELGGQRESLLRSQRRLQHADDDLSKSHAAIRAINRHVLHNKFILILIILLEIGILVGLIVIKIHR